MNKNPNILFLEEKLLIGKKLNMSFSLDKTPILWKSFMPFRTIISQKKNDLLLSVNIYESDYFKNFNPKIIYTKWAAVEVNSIENLPAEMSSIAIPEGLYAQFSYQGKHEDGLKLFEYIFSQWLPNCEYELDDRPHFEQFDKSYHPMNLLSKEDIFIPIKLKNIQGL